MGARIRSERRLVCSARRLIPARMCKDAPAMDERTGFVTRSILAVPILRLVYGEEFAGAVIIVRLLAVQAVVAAAVFGCFVALKAADRLEQLWLMRTATAVVAITSALVLATSFGLTGAGLASVLSDGEVNNGKVVLRTVPLTREGTLRISGDRSGQQACDDDDTFVEVFHLSYLRFLAVGFSARGR